MPSVPKIDPVKYAARVRVLKQRRTYARLVMTAYALFCILVFSILWHLLKPYGPLWNYFVQ